MKYPRYIWIFFSPWKKNMAMGKIQHLDGMKNQATFVRNTQRETVFEMFGSGLNPLDFWNNKNIWIELTGFVDYSQYWRLFLLVQIKIVFFCLRGEFQQKSRHSYNEFKVCLVWNVVRRVGELGASWCEQKGGGKLEWVGYLLHNRERASDVELPMQVSVDLSTS